MHGLNASATSDLCTVKKVNGEFKVSGFPALHTS